jgi:hypothetical protein
MHLHKALKKAQKEGYWSIRDKYDRNPTFRHSINRDGWIVGSMSYAVAALLGLDLVPPADAAVTDGGMDVGGAILNINRYISTLQFFEYLQDHDMWWLCMIMAFLAFMLGMAIGILVDRLYNGIVVRFEAWVLWRQRAGMLLPNRRASPAARWHWMVRRLFRLRGSQRRWAYLGHYLQSMGWTAVFRSRLSAILHQE